MVKKQRGKEERFMKNINHNISREIVAIAEKQKGNGKDVVIVMENLKNIRERMKATKNMTRKLQSWNFAQLQNFIEYKANWSGIPVVKISARYTSQMCNNCKHVDRKNRPTQSNFKCKKCGYEANADFNASVNIANKFYEELKENKK